MLEYQTREVLPRHGFNVHIRTRYGEVNVVACAIETQEMDGADTNILDPHDAAAFHVMLRLWQIVQKGNGRAARHGLDVK